MKQKKLFLLLVIILGLLNFCQTLTAQEEQTTSDDEQFISEEDNQETLLKPDFATLPKVKGPVVLKGENLELTEKFISSEGDGIIVETDEDVSITGCKIVAKGIGIVVKGSGIVSVESCEIYGSPASIKLSENAQLGAVNTDFNGKMIVPGTAEFFDEGDNNFSK